MIPEIKSSTKEEREIYIKEQFRCRADCDNCGICSVYRGKDPVIVFEEYIKGTREFFDIQSEYRNLRQ